MRLNSYKIILFVLLMAAVRPLKAQVDTLFWFAAPEVSYSPNASIFDRPILLRIATYAQPATVTVSQPAGGGMPPQTLVIAANSAQSIDLTPWIDIIENKPANNVLNYGLKISATAPVSAYYDVVSGGGIHPTYNPELFSLKGRNALGTDFLIPTQNFLNNDPDPNYSPRPFSSFDVIATESNTTVTITPSADIVGHTAGVTFTVVLNEGQTWSATAASHLAAQHLQGSRVTADKPVAVTVKDDLLLGTPFGGCADLAGDQIVPVPLLGTEYIAMRGRLNNPYDQLFVTALQNGTTITHDGTLVATINAGATHRLTVGNPSSYIQTNNPVSVWQLSGVGCEVGACQLPQIECTGSNSVSYIRATANSLYFNLLVRNGGQGNFLVNGAAGVITAGQFSAVTNTGGNWYAAQVTIPVGTYPQGSVINVSNTSTLFHLGVLEGGTNGGTSYGYFSNFSQVAAQATASTHSVCADDTIRLFAAGLPGATYQWTGPGSFNSTQQNPVIPHASVSGTGVYTLTVSMPGCSSGTDTVNVSVHAYPNPDLGNDVSLCVDSLTLRPVNPPPAGSVYSWSTGSVADTLRVGRSDIYWLGVTTNGCTAFDTIEVDLNGSLSVNLGPDIRICDRDTPYILTSLQPPGTQYLWNNGWSSPQLSVVTTGSYWLRVTLNGCVASDTIQVAVLPTPVADIGPDTTICAQYPHRIGTEVAGASYLWSTGAASPYINVDATGSYMLTVEVAGCADSDTINVTAIPVPDIDLGSDRDICPDQTIVLDAGYGLNSRYHWNSGDTTAQYAATSGGVYSVWVTTVHGCEGGDTVTLNAIVGPIVSLGSDTTVCEETPLLLRPSVLNADSLLWSDGSRGEMLRVRYGGAYTVTAFNACGSESDTIQIQQIFCDIWVPNAFTPNGDGRNDVFRVLGNTHRAEGFSLSVFNRWGQRVFHTRDRNAGWDGYHNGVSAALGTYVYVVEYELGGKPVLLKGSFHLLR